MANKCNLKPKKIVAVLLLPYYWEQILDASMYWKVSTDEILNTRIHKDHVVKARQTFYWLCFKQGLDIYRLSVNLGRHRSTILNSMKSYPRPDVIHEHIKNILNKKQNEKKSNGNS